MKILIINPNSDPQMGKEIQENAEDFAKGRFEVVCKNTPVAPAFIETYEDMSKAAAGMIQLARENESKFNAFVIASMLGHQFSILTTDDHSIPIHEELVRKYNLYEVLASVRAPGREFDKCSEEEKYLATARLAIKKDRAEVIVLGCAGLTGLDRSLRRELNVPVLDGVVCALFIAAGLAEI